VTLCAAVLAAALLQTTPPMRTLERGDQSFIDNERQAVARTAAEWTALWRQHAPDRAAPAVDFTKEMVVGVFLGSRNTAGYGVDIVGTEIRQGAVVVRYRQRAPAADAITAQIITMPYHLVAIAKAAGEVKFERVP
jgi:hypothetical protein